MADLGSGLSSTNDRLNEIDQITKPVKAILTRLNLIEHRFEQIEQSLNETNFNEKIRKSHEIESLNKILDYLSKHYVQVINQQAVFEAQINATLGIVDYLQKHLIIDSTPSSFSSSISFSNHSTF